MILGQRFVCSLIILVAAAAVPVAALEKQLTILGDRTDAVVVSVTARVEKLPKGSYAYAYTVYSSTASLKPVALFALDLGLLLSDPREIRSPDGWTFARCSKPVKACWFWNNRAQGELKPGGMLGGFTLTSAVAPHPTRYYSGNHPDGDEIDDSDSFASGFVTGTVPGPALKVPSDVANFLEREEQCRHWGGERPSDKNRADYIARAIKRLRCESIGEDQKTLLGKHRGNAAVQEAFEQQSRRTAEHDHVDPNSEAAENPQ